MEKGKREQYTPLRYDFNMEKGKRRNIRKSSEFEEQIKLSISYINLSSSLTRTLATDDLS